MNIVLKRFVGTILGVALIGGGVIGAVLFVKSRPQAGRRAMSSMVPVVECTPLVVEARPLVVECLGTVIADKTASVQPEVAGPIVAVHPRLVEGGRVKKGDVLVEIEDGDYRLGLKRAVASLVTAQGNLRIEEGQQEAVRHEAALMGGDESEAYRDLVLREPQLKSAQAAVKVAEVGVEEAGRDLEDATIKAPFDAVVVATDADVGDYAQPGRALFELAATDRYFVRASIPLSALKAMSGLGEKPYSATVTTSDGSMRKAETYTLVPALTPTGRMASLVLTVDTPYGRAGGRPLLLDEVVRVSIDGDVVKGVSLIPRGYLRDGNVVWMIDKQSRLRVLPAEVLQGYADQVLVRVDAGPGLELVTTDLYVAVEGMQVRRMGEAERPSAKPGPADDGQGSPGRPAAAGGEGR